MRLPCDLTGVDPVKRLAKQYHVTILLRVGTLAAILADVAEVHSKERLLS